MIDELNLLLIGSIVLSLIFLGVLRTALWILPGLFVDFYFSIAASAWVSFFCALALTAPYRKGSFDLRDKEKAYWISILFLTGLGTGLFHEAAEYWVYGLGSLFILFFLRLYFTFRLPVSKIAVFPQWIRALPILIFIFCCFYL